MRIRTLISCLPFALACTSTICSGFQPLGDPSAVAPLYNAGWASRGHGIDNQGNVTVVWNALGDNGQDVYLRRYSESGAPKGAVTRVNTYTEEDQVSPDVAVLPSGEAMVVWMSDREVGPFGQVNFGIFGKIYAADGSVLVDEFRVSTHADQFDQQYRPRIDDDGLGQFVCVWRGSYDANDGLYAQYITLNGGKLPTPVTVSTTDFGDPIVAVQPGEFNGVVSFVWGTSGDKVFCRRHQNATLIPLGVATQVNLSAVWYPNPAADVDANGNTAIVWEHSYDDSTHGVLLNSAGHAVLSDTNLGFSASSGSYDVCFRAPAEFMVGTTVGSAFVYRIFGADGSPVAEQQTVSTRPSESAIWHRMAVRNSRLICTWTANTFHWIRFFGDAPQPPRFTSLEPFSVDVVTLSLSHLLVGESYDIWVSHNLHEGEEWASNCTFSATGSVQAVSVTNESGQSASFFRATLR